MAAPKILVFSGSLRTGSHNWRLAALACKELMLADADVLIIENGKLGAEELSRASSLKLIHTFGLMTDNIDHTACRARGIPIKVLDRHTNRMVAEHVVVMMLALFRDYKPLSFFGGIGLLLAGLSCVPGFRVISEYYHTGHVLRMPSAVLATGILLIGVLSGIAGLILHTIAQRFRDVDHQLQLLAELMKSGSKEPQDR